MPDPAAWLVSADESGTVLEYEIQGEKGSLVALVTSACLVLRSDAAKGR